MVPTEADIGELAHPVPVPPPTLDATLVQGFGLLDATGRIQPLRIGVWGDSHMAAGTFSGELARVIGTRGGEVDTTYLPATMGRSGVRLPIRKHCQSSTWKIEPAYTSSRTARVGPSLVDLRSTRRGAYLWLDFRLEAQPSRVTAVRVMYLPTSAVSSLGITLDSGAEQKVPLARTSAGADNVRTAEIEIAATGGAALDPSAAC